jgi:hypothetical protein
MNFPLKLTRTTLLIGCGGFLVGTIVGTSVFSFFVPDALDMMTLYKEEKKLVSDLRTNKKTDTSTMWLENAKSMRAKSEDEFISDMININNTVILMNSRLQLGMYPSTKEIRFFGEEAARERRTENEILEKLSKQMASQK